MAKGDKKRYFYVGYFVHRKDEIFEKIKHEKKIGVTDKPEKREVTLSGTKSPFRFEFLYIWDCDAHPDKANGMEDRVKKSSYFNEIEGTEEWFEDDDDNAFFEEIKEIAKDRKYIDVTEQYRSSDDPIQKQVSKDKKKIESQIEDIKEFRKENLHLLDGEEFFYYKGKPDENKVKIIKKSNGEIRFISSLTGNKEYKTGNAAFHDAPEEAGKNIPSINFWDHVKNNQGKTPQQVLEEKAKK